MPKEENYKHIGAVYSVYFGDDSRVVSRLSKVRKTIIVTAETGIRKCGLP